jgi:peroxiredoxin
MESSSLNNLTTIKFKSLHKQEIGYAELFSGYRTLIFSIPKPIVQTAFWHFKSFAIKVNAIEQLGVDKVCCVSFEPWIVPYVEIHSTGIIPLHDYSTNFVSYLKEYTNSDVTLKTLYTHWQYVVIVDNGKVEKLFSNPVKDNMPLKIHNDPRYKFRNLDTDTIIRYLDEVDNKR